MATDLTEYKTVGTKGVVPVNVHNNMSGLQGGLPGEYIHLTAAEYAALGSGGGMKIYPLQEIAAAGKITLGAEIQQMLKVGGLAGAQVANDLPFDIAPADGTIIVLKGDVNILTINDTSLPGGGCDLNGDAFLGVGNTLTLVYDATITIYTEIART